jgi:hypothetical protein
MAKRIIVAALLGAVAMFAWEFIAHMASPLGEAGVQALPNEQAVMAVVKDTVRESGFYLFPAPENRPGMTREQKQQAMDKMMEGWHAGPAGILIAHPKGRSATFTGEILTQFATDVLVMLVAALLLSRSIAKGYGSRVLFVAWMGLLPTLGTEIPQWNWYGFPTTYAMGQLVVHLVGFIAGGLVLAKIVPIGFLGKSD